MESDLGHPGRGLAGLRASATKALASYTDPANHFAFHTYDRLGDPGAPLTPADVLMANLLSLRLGWREVIPLFSASPDDGDAHTLRSRLDGALATLRYANAFEDHASLDELEATVAPVALANDATKDVAGWTYVTVSKVLHRRLPHIVPIIDSRVRTFYGTRKPSAIRAALWKDLRENQRWLSEEAAKHPTPDGRPMTLLRCADILIWSAS